MSPAHDLLVRVLSPWPGCRSRTPQWRLCPGSQGAWRRGLPHPCWESGENSGNWNSQIRWHRGHAGDPGHADRGLSRQGPSAGRTSILAWPSGGQGPVCSPGPARTIKAPKRRRSSACEQDPGAPALSRASPGTSSSGPALGCPCQAGRSPPALHLLLCDLRHPLASLGAHPKGWHRDSGHCA